MSHRPQRRIGTTGIGQPNYGDYGEVATEEPGSTVSLSALLSAVARRKTLFAFPILTCLALGVAYVVLAAPKYESTAKLLVQDKGMPLNQVNSQIRREDEFLATQAEVLSSYAVVASAVETLELPPSIDPAIDSTLVVRDAMTVVPLKDTDVLEVRYLADNGDDAQRTLDAIVTSYKEFLKQDDRDVYRETLNVLTKNEKEIRDELSEKKAELMQLRKSGPLIGQGKDPAEVQKTMLTNLGQTVVNAKNRRIELENQVAAFKKAEPQVAEELLKMQKRNIPNNDDGRARDPIGIQMTLLIDLGEAKIDATNRRIELENQIKAFRTLSASKTGGRISPAALESVRSTFTRKLPGKSGSRTSTPVLDAGSKLGANREGSYSLISTDEPGLIRQALFQAQARHAELSQKYGEKHPLILAVRKQIEEWQTRLKETTTAALDNLDQEFDVVLNHMQKELDAATAQEDLLVTLYEKEFLTAQASVIGHLQKELTAAQQQEKQLASLYDEEFKKAKGVDSFVMQEEQLRDDIVHAKTMHDSLLAQLSHWQLTSQSVADVRSAVKVTVLESPKVPLKAAWPIPWLVLGLCGVIGSFGGLGLVTLAERPGTPEKSASTGMISVPIVAEIPRSTEDFGPVPADVRLDRLVHERPESQVSEAYRSLRTRLEIANRSGRPPIVQIASPTNSADNTTVMTNLAFSFAQLGRRVVVVDADLRNGQLHNTFDVSNVQGLSGVLNNSSTLHDALATSPLERVTVLPCGPHVDDPSAFLDTREFASILESLRSQFDVVLVDSSGLLNDEAASIVASHSDCVLLTTTLDQDSEQDVQRANELLNSLGVQASGIVVCEAPSEVSNDPHLARIGRSANGNRKSADIG